MPAPSRAISPPVEQRGGGSSAWGATAPLEAAPPTQPYRPRTNGEAERFIQTLLREWACGRLYGSSAERAGQLADWLARCDYRRKHGPLGHRPPAARLEELRGNDLARSCG